jgi:transcriptional regulator with XRE-family HTH domain
MRYKGLPYLSRTISKARGDQGLTLMDLHRLSGVCRPTLRVLERGEGTGGTVAALLRAANALGLDVVLVRKRGQSVDESG